MRPASLDRFAALGVVLFTSGLHARSIGYGFVNWDDDRFITNNPLFAAGGWTYVRAALTRVQFEAYHPLHLLSFLPDRWLWPGNPGGFHASSVLLFTLNVLLLFVLARRHAGRGAAALAALLFAAHPLCVEPVDWISDRKDLLATAFSLGVLLVEDQRAPDDLRISTTGLVLFAAAILSKTSALCLPPAIFCWLVWLRRVDARTAAFRVFPYGVLGLIPAIAVVTIWKQHQMIAARPIAAPIDVLSTLATYARRVVWPSDLAAIYPVEMPAAVLSAVIMGALAVTIIGSWRRLPSPARFAVVAFFIALLPVSNIVPINFRITDRYALFALAILVPPGAIGLQALFDRGRISRGLAIGGAFVAFLVLALAMHRLDATWADSRALWAHATAIHPDAYLARIKYGETLVELGDWPDARTEYQAAVRMLPLNYYGYAGLFYVYAHRAEEQGRIPDGTAKRWRAEIDEAQYRSSSFDGLIGRVPHAACPECFDTLLLLRVRRWPRPDEELCLSARAALDAGTPDVAFILLAGATHKEAPEWQALEAEAERSARAPRAATGGTSGD